jgi:hypothetical protein
MSDIGIFMFGLCVLGVALAATMVAMIGSSRSDDDENEVLRIARQEEESSTQEKRFVSHAK